MPRVNAPHVHESDKFYGIKTSWVHSDLTASLNSSVVLLQKLLSGFASLGQGALKTPVYAVKEFQIPNITIMPIQDIQDSLFKRHILPIEEELSKPDRQILDNIVFDVLDLTQGERDAVYEAVISLVEGRLKKAGSV